MFKITGKFTTATVMIDDVEEKCIGQITKMASHPSFTNPIAIMPDTHAGMSSVIGFTMPMVKDNIIPNVIGVDIGCGMLSMNFGRHIDRIDLAKFDLDVREEIPFGCRVNDAPVIDMKKDFPWEDVNNSLKVFINTYNEKFGTSHRSIEYDMNWFLAKCKQIKVDPTRIIAGIGSLGGGNHFIEMGVDLNEDRWVTIHTGSRNFGKMICEFWQDRAHAAILERQPSLNDAIKEIRSKYTGHDIKTKIDEARAKLSLSNTNSKDDLQCLVGSDAIGYLIDMIFAQAYAKFNRKYIGDAICRVLGGGFKDSIECIHNYIDFDDMIIRKGSIRSYVGERMIIPFNMRDGILICEGKGNPDWNFSAPHGAGRVLSRSGAKKSLSMDEFTEQMKDIYSTSVVPGTLDEAPGAYKDAAIIEDAIGPTATIINRIKPICNMKDN